MDMMEEDEEKQKPQLKSLTISEGAVVEEGWFAPATRWFLILTGSHT